MQEVYCLVAALGVTAVAGYFIYQHYFKVPPLTEAEKKAIEDAKATAAALAAGGAAVVTTTKPIENNIKNLGTQAVAEGASIEEHEGNVANIQAEPEPPKEFQDIDEAHGYFHNILNPKDAPK